MSDRCAPKWADLLDDDDLEMLKVTDSESVDHGEPISYPYPVS